MIHKCPVCETYTKKKDRLKYFTHEGSDFGLMCEMYVCDTCDLEIGTAKQVGDIQKKLQGIINKRG